MDIKEITSRLRELQMEIPAGVRLVAVSKFQPIEYLQEAYLCGQRHFGESRVQEFLEKYPQMPKDTKWHFIGHLQTNKLRQIIGKTYLIESIDSERLLALVDEESRKKEIITNVLLQVHIAIEETKFGFSPEEVKEYFLKKKYEQLTNTHICGLMAMASNTDEEMQVRREFTSVSKLYNEIAEVISPELRGFDTISMGMSGDWPIAVEEGATEIRVGSSIFGERG